MGNRAHAEPRKRRRLIYRAGNQKHNGQLPEGVTVGKGETMVAEAPKGRLAGLSTTDRCIGTLALSPSHHTGSQISVDANVQGQLRAELRDPYGRQACRHREEVSEMGSAIVLGLLVCLAAVAGAHKPDGETFYAVQFPDHDVPVIDGNLDDWDLVPEKYSIRSNRLFSPAKSVRDVERGEYDSSDIEIRHRIGFNPNTERLYFAFVVIDNYHDIDRESIGALWTDDSIDLRLNPTAVPAEEQNLEGEPANSMIYLLAVPPLEGIYHLIFPGGYDWMLDGGGHLDFGWSFAGEMLDSGESTYIYEMSMTPIVALGESAAETEFMDVEEGEQVHFNILVPDIDGPEPATYNGFWGVSPGPLNEPECDLYLAELEDVWSPGQTEDPQTPIQWTVEAGGNGHYYEAILDKIPWTEARAAAEAETFMGMPGHLVTIESAEENAFVANLERTWSFWLGAFQSRARPSRLATGSG